VARQDPDHLRELLSAIPELTGRPATAEDRGRFERYLDLFTRWNQVHRMTALRSPAEVVRGLFLDSLLFLPVLVLPAILRAPIERTGRWALLKLVTGALRIGISARLAKTAAAALGDKDQHEVELIWPGLSPPYLDLFAWLEGRA